MKVPAIVLAMVLSAASLSGQALMGYAGATAVSGSTAAGASKVADPAAGLNRKMAAATGQTETTGPNTTGNSRTHTEGQTQVHVHPAEHSQSGMHPGAHSGAHSQMHCKEMKSDAQGMSGKQCREMHGTDMHGTDMDGAEMHGTRAACCRKSKDGKMAGTSCCRQGQCARMKKEAEKKS